MFKALLFEGKQFIENSSYCILWQMREKQKQTSLLHSRVADSPIVVFTQWWRAWR